ncbi:MAG: ComEC/Rec2 family competence protein [Oculatellaceae cyanobacterium Prado106]|nr:ComEC/Rec2 family competence protein [Oculatellaceae cyanobacterium Prado106]
MAYLVGLLLTGLPWRFWGVPVGAIAVVVMSAIAFFWLPRLWKTDQPRFVWLITGCLGLFATFYYPWRLPQPTFNDISHLLTSPDISVSVQVEGTLDSSPRLTRSGRTQFELKVTQATLIPEASQDNPKTESPNAKPATSASPKTKASSSSVPQPGAAKISVASSKAPKPEPSKSSDSDGKAPASQTKSTQLPEDLSEKSSKGTVNPVGDQVEGILYVTIPRSQTAQLYPDRQVRITGTLYQPKPAANPGGFDFQKYLAQTGIFAGLQGKEIRFPNVEQQKVPLMWRVQQRIIQAQVRGLGATAGQLLSAIVMGRGGVDVPYEVQDRFARVGLAHALAASGTQVSMIAGIILALTQRLKPWMRLGIGLGTLGIYMGLTGFEPSVLRAGIMGAVVFLALTWERKVKPIELLLFTATAMLMWNPIWIWSLAFQLSFLATLGLMVTAPILTTWFDWVPTRIAPMLAVPIAAYIWTIPLQLYVFGIVSPYSIGINILSTLLIEVLSIGGMFSALAALAHPLAGSASAWLLQLPMIAFLKLAEWGDRLPANNWAIGTISASQVLLIYGIYLLIWWQTKWRRYTWIASLTVVALIAVPVGYNAIHQFQVSILATTDDAVFVLQDRSRVMLVNSGSEKDVEFTVVPFLRKQGVNRIDWAIAPHLKSSEIPAWQKLITSLPIRMFYQIPEASSKSSSKESSNSSSFDLTTHLRELDASIKTHKGVSMRLSGQERIRLGTQTIELVSTNPPILQIKVQSKTWILLPPLSFTEQRRVISRLPHADVLWWTGGSLLEEMLNQLQPRVAIASKSPLPPPTQTWFQQHPKTKLYQTEQEGAIRWTPRGGFEAMFEGVGSGE